MKAYIFICLLIYSSLSAQSGIEGQVADKKGIPIPGANVLLNGGVRGTATSSEGYFRFDDLEPGMYSLKVSAVGFSLIQKDSLKVESSMLSLSLVLDESVIETEQIVVTASKYSQQIKDLPVSAAILTRSAVKDKVIIDLDEALRYVPGVSMTLDQISIRGSSGYARGVGSRVVTALDGFPMTSGDTGEIIWEIFPVNIVERIEVIKGAASSLYGSNAIGGVVNFITEKISHNETYIRTYGGMYSAPEYDIWKWNSTSRYFSSISVTQKVSLPSAKFLLSLTHMNNEGYRKDDDYRRNSFFLKADAPLSGSSSITVLANGLLMNRGNFLYWKDSQNVLVPRDAESGQRVESARYFGGLMYKNAVSEELLVTNRLSYYSTKWEDGSSVKNTSTTGLLRNDVSIDYQILDNLNTITGFELVSGKTEANIFGNRTSQGAGIYLQSEYKGITDFILSTGFRYDYFKAEDLVSQSALSPKLGINYKPNNKIILRFSAGTGFRAPSLAELFSNTNIGGLIIKPNPDLESESVVNIEAGGNLLLADGHALDIAFFNSNYKNFIEPSLDPADGKLRFANLADAVISGTEFTLTNKIPLLALELQNSFMYLDTKDKEKNKEMKYRPKYTITSSWKFTFGKFTLDYDFRYWSKIAEIDNELISLGLVKDGDKRTEVYLSNVSAGYMLSEYGIPAKLSLAVKNLFNYNYVEMIGNLSPLRNFTLNLEVLF